MISIELWRGRIGRYFGRSRFHSKIGMEPFANRKAGPIDAMSWCLGVIVLSACLCYAVDTTGQPFNTGNVTGSVNCYGGGVVVENSRVSLWLSNIGSVDGVHLAETVSGIATYGGSVTLGGEGELFGGGDVYTPLLVWTTNNLYARRRLLYDIEKNPGPSTHPPAPLTPPSPHQPSDCGISAAGRGQTGVLPLREDSGSGCTSPQTCSPPLSSSVGPSPEGLTSTPVPSDSCYTHDAHDASSDTGGANSGSEGWSGDHGSLHSEAMVATMATGCGAPGDIPLTEEEEQTLRKIPVSPGEVPIRSGSRPGSRLGTNVGADRDGADEVRDVTDGDEDNNDDSDEDDNDNEYGAGLEYDADRGHSRELLEEFQNSWDGDLSWEGLKTDNTINPAAQGWGEMLRGGRGGGGGREGGKKENMDAYRLIRCDTDEEETSHNSNHRQSGCANIESVNGQMSGHVRTGNNDSDSRSVSGVCWEQRRGGGWEGGNMESQEVSEEVGSRTMSRGGNPRGKTREVRKDDDDEDDNEEEKDTTEDELHMSGFSERSVFNRSITPTQESQFDPTVESQTDIQTEPDMHTYTQSQTQTQLHTHPSSQTTIGTDAGTDTQQDTLTIVIYDSEDEYSLPKLKEVRRKDRVGGGRGEKGKRGDSHGDSDLAQSETSSGERGWGGWSSHNSNKESHDVQSKLRHGTNSLGAMSGGTARNHTCSKSRLDTEREGGRGKGGGIGGEDTDKVIHCVQSISYAVKDINSAKSTGTSACKNTQTLMQESKLESKLENILTVMEMLWRTQDQIDKRSQIMNNNQNELNEIQKIMIEKQDKVAEQLQDMKTEQTNMHNAIKGIHKQIDETNKKVQNNTEEIGAVKNKQKGLEEKIRELEDNRGKLGELEERIKELKEDRGKTGKLEDRIRELENDKERMGKKIDRIEGISRRNNIRIFGVKEEEGGRMGRGRGEDMKRLARKVIETAMPEGNWGKDFIESAYRIGPPRAPNAEPRTLIVRMQEWSDVMKVIKNHRGRDWLKRQGVGISMDVTSDQAEQLKKLKEEGKTGYFYRGELRIRGEHYPKHRHYPHHTHLTQYPQHMQHNNTQQNQQHKQQQQCTQQFQHPHHTQPLHPQHGSQQAQHTQHPWQAPNRHNYEAPSLPPPQTQSQRDERLNLASEKNFQPAPKEKRDKRDSEKHQGNHEKAEKDLREEQRGKGTPSGAQGGDREGDRDSSDIGTDKSREGHLIQQKKQTPQTKHTSQQPNAETHSAGNRQSQKSIQELTDKQLEQTMQDKGRKDRLAPTQVWPSHGRLSRGGHAVMAEASKVHEKARNPGEFGDTSLSKIVSHNEENVKEGGKSKKDGKGVEGVVDEGGKRLKGEKEKLEKLMDMEKNKRNIVLGGPIHDNAQESCYSSTATGENVRRSMDDMVGRMNGNKDERKERSVDVSRVRDTRWTGGNDQGSEGGRGKREGNKRDIWGEIETRTTKVAKPKTPPSFCLAGRAKINIQEKIAKQQVPMPKKQASNGTDRGGRREQDIEGGGGEYIGKERGGREKEEKGVVSKQGEKDRMMMAGTENGKETTVQIKTKTAEGEEKIKKMSKKTETETETKVGLEVEKGGIGEGKLEMNKKTEGGPYGNDGEHDKNGKMAEKSISRPTSSDRLQSKSTSLDKSTGSKNICTQSKTSELKANTDTDSQPVRSKRLGQGGLYSWLGGGKGETKGEQGGEWEKKRGGKGGRGGSQRREGGRGGGERRDSNRRDSIAARGGSGGEAGLGGGRILRSQTRGR